MKRRDLLAHLSAHGCSWVREGARHTVWRNDRTGQQTAVPRHTEIVEPMVRKICKDLSIPRP